MGDDAAADDHATRRMQLQQEQLARPERSGVGRHGSQEMDLGEVRLLSQHGDPVVTHDGDDEVDPHLFHRLEFVDTPRTQPPVRPSVGRDRGCQFGLPPVESPLTWSPTSELLTALAITS